MSKECNGKPIVFQGHGRREMTASFDGGRLSSYGDALLLREADNVFGVTGWLAGCFSDHRAPERSQHGLYCLVAQRVMTIALGYEDLNDHGQLRDDSVLALAGFARFGMPHRRATVHCPWWSRPSAQLPV